MQRLDRRSWLTLIGSLILAGALVALIPTFGLVGGHADHGGEFQSAMHASTHHYMVLPNGVDMMMTATAPDDAATIATIRQHMEQEALRFRAGDFSEDMQTLSADTQAQLLAKRDALTVTVVSDASGSTIQIRSDDPTVVTLLTTWATQMSAEHTRHTMNP
ncbi:MAG: hypothetical protein RLY87_661 [Chloroflexota bacterium]|jgi:hypothetical protein